MMLQYGCDTTGEYLGESLEIADRRQVHVFAITFSIMLLLFVTFFPERAWAWGFDDFFDGLASTIVGPIIATMSEGLSELYSYIGSITVIGAAHNQDWNAIFAPIYNVLIMMQKTVITPVAMQILTLSMMLRLLGITRIAESHDMSPLATRIGVTLIVYFFMMFLVANATSIITVGWDLFQHMISAVDTAMTGGQAWDTLGTMTAQEITDANPNMSDLFLALGGMIISFLAMAIAYGVAIFAYYSKILKLYLLAFAAPLGVSFFGIESTKHWGLTFVKNVGVNLLSLVLVYVILKIFPMLMSAVASAGQGGGDASNIIKNMLTASGQGFATASPDLVVMLVLNILLIAFLVRSSSIAREILGG